MVLFSTFFAFLSLVILERLLSIQYYYTGGENSFVVPDNAVTMIVSLYAAQGGNSHWGYGDIGGLGGYISVQIPVATGQTYYYYVGGSRDNPCRNNGCWGASGGGYTYIKSSSGFIAIAGGGGGAGESRCQMFLLFHNKQHH